MDIEIDKTNQIADLLQNAKSIAIMPSKVAGVDAFGAGLGLYYMLKSEDKDVSLVYQGAKPFEFNDCVDDSEITTDVGNRKLVISVDYTGTDASKVHYSTENNVLYLTLSPIIRNFDLEKVKARVQGYDYDLIFSIGAQDPEDFGQVFKDLETEFYNATVLNIDNTARNQRFGKINIVDDTVDSLSILVLNKALEWGLKLETKAAKAFLKGMTLRKGI